MYFFDSRVRYSEVNGDGKLSIGSIINYFQDCSTFQSEDLGCGIEKLKSMGKGWFIVHWHIELQNEAVLGMPLRIGTSAYKFDNYFGYRNFIIYSGNKIVATADSKWFVYDFNLKKPIHLTEIENVFPVEEKIEMKYEDKKLCTLKDGIIKNKILIEKFHTDTNGHVNNETYIDFALSYLPENFIIQNIYVDYKQQARYKDVLIPMVCIKEDGIVVALILEETKKVCANIYFTNRKEDE